LVPDKGLSDLQTRGTFTFWHHTHEFYESNGGTVIRDNVDYKLPGWVPGNILAQAYVKKGLEKTFIFRRQQIEKLFIQDPKSNRE
jgi:ligand-binding SRPBCC domain-containing protein